MVLLSIAIFSYIFAAVLMLSRATRALFSFKGLSIDMYPDVEIPAISIVTEYPGASPETVERKATKHIEDAVNPISGVKHIMSSCLRPNLTLMTLN